MNENPTMGRCTMWLAVAMAMCLTLGACSRDEADDTVVAEETVETTSASSSTSTTVADAEPPAEETEQGDEVERRPFRGALGTQPTYLPPGLYTSNSLEVPIDFEVPETAARMRWMGLHDRARQMVVVLTTPEPVPGPDQSARPGFSVATPSDGLSVDQAVDAILTAVPSSGEPFFTAEPGQFLGNDATVIRGNLSQDIEFQNRGEWIIELPDGTEILTLEQPERTYLMYVLDLDGRTVIIEMNAHPDQFDLSLTEGLRMAETIARADR